MDTTTYSVPGVYFEVPRVKDMRMRGVPVGVAGFFGYVEARGTNPDGSVWPVMLDAPEQIDLKLSAPAWGNVIPSLRAFFANGGKRCYVAGMPLDTVHNEVDLIGGGEPGRRVGLTAFDSVGDVELLAIPDLYVVPPGCEPPELANILNVHYALLDFCKGEREASLISQGGYFAVLDAPPGLAEDEVIQYAKMLRGHDNAEYAALFYPWVDVMGKNGMTRMPPCGQIAGVMSRLSQPPEGKEPGSVSTDTGPHLSPANQVLPDVVGTEVELLRMGTKDLIEAGINCLLPWTGRGIVVWGTRTLSPAVETNHITVRRVLSYVQRSVYAGTQWAVFESNDHNLWKQLDARISVFMEDLWKKGLLVGNAESDAFIVQCDEELNHEMERDDGRLHVLLLVKPVRSTEFIVLRITHEGSVSSAGEAGGEE